MPIRLATPSPAAERLNESPARWTCALVNNMPDGAFEATERQYLGLLDAGSGSDAVEVRRYAMAEIPRGDRVAERIAAEYLDAERVRDDPPDLLIVTGSNPLEPNIEDEPYWPRLASLVEWARDGVTSTLLSCLAAHAALKVLDGIERVRLPAKCTGVFTQSVDVTHPLGAGVAPQVDLPHSRNNTAPQDQLEAAGYRVVVQSDEVGWGVAQRRDGDATMLLVQGHPEYDPSSLLREYHRDARRFVLRERDDEPRLPWHCVSRADWDDLVTLHHAVLEQRDPALLDAYPFDEVGDRAPWPWRAMAERFYANWLADTN